MTSRVFAAAGPEVRKLFSCALAGDSVAREVILAAMPSCLPPLARRQLRDARLAEIAALVYGAIPGAAPYTVAQLIHAAGLEVESGRTLDHPAFERLADARRTISAIIQDMMAWLPANASSRRRMPSIDTIFDAIK